MKLILISLLLMTSFYSQARKYPENKRSSIHPAIYPFYNLGRPWRNGVVPYIIDKSFNIPSQRNIHLAISEYHKKTQVRFVPWTGQRNYIYIVKNQKKGNMSTFLGMRGGRQMVFLKTYRYDQVSRGTTIHELGHVVGLLHEHQRADRNKYIKMYWKNLKFFRRGNYFKAFFYRPKTEFDWDSIMLYGSYSTKNSRNEKKPVMLARESNEELKRQRTGLSEGDIEKIRLIYESELP